MILKTLKKEFSETLADFYPESEINSFFNLLAEGILKMKRVDIALNMYAVISGKKYDKFKLAMTRLKCSEPIQYILGSTEFYGLPLTVNEHTLIPRPETEELVELIIKTVNLNAIEKPLNILDIGTGSGCIAIALAKQLPNAKIFALDVSAEALKIAKKNAELNEVEIAFFEADVLTENTWDLEFKDLVFDAIVSNPPYVREQEKAHMHKNVLEFEPDSALFVKDENPLVFYKAITEFAAHNLSQNGKLFFEINEYLGNEMKALLKTHNFQTIELTKDLSGKDRMLKGVRS